MRDLREEHRALFRVNSWDALSRVKTALDFLWKENKKSMHDKVAGDFDYEELIAALLCAEEALSEARDQEHG